MGREYGFLMIGYDKPKFIQELQDRIPIEELYTEDGSDDYGVENETHVTLVPCMDKHLNVESLKNELNTLSDYDIVLSNVSKFENDKYDVLKCDVCSCYLTDTNKRICAKFPNFSEYDEYHPHLTIAYLKKGMADKYLQQYLTPLVILKPSKFMWSGSDKDDNDIDLEW